MSLYGKEYFINESGYISDIGKYVKKFIEFIKGKSGKSNNSEEEKYRKKMEKYKDEYNNLTSSEMNKLKALFKKKEAEVDKLIKDEERRMLHDKEYVAQIRKAIDEAFEDFDLDPDDPEYKPFYKTNKLPKLISDNDGDYWIIIDESQEMRYVCRFICSDIAEYVENKIGCYANAADDDDGCICIDIFYDYFQFYIHFKDEIKGEKK